MVFVKLFTKLEQLRLGRLKAKGLFSNLPVHVLIPCGMRDVNYNCKYKVEQPAIDRDENSKQND